MELVAVPPDVVTEILPVVALEGTVAVTCVALTAVKDVAAVPLNLTAVAPVRFVPVRVTTVPTIPELGLKDVSTGSKGAGVTVRFASVEVTLFTELDTVTLNLALLSAVVVAGVV